MQGVLHARYCNTHENEQKRYFIEMKSQAKTSGIILPKVHGGDKGVDLDLRPEKQIINPLVTPQLHVSTELKDKHHVKPRLGQDRAGIKKKMLRFPVS